MLLKWYDGIPIDTAKDFSLLAIVVFVFVACGQFMWLALINIAIFLGVLERFTTIMHMEEKTEVPESERSGKPKVSLENANFGWGFRVK